ncbi:hypothetical protein DXT91_10360 [Agrobacterium tumefaciens]|nr:hypothetical protein [Agrobacterium tumefaciens]
MTPRQVTLTQNDFEDLFVNNQYMLKVETYLNRFNPITTMRMERMEIRHSAILAWLLDPRETHGLQDKFLRTFLCEAMRGQGHMGNPTALEISQADLRDADVRREWQSIDIFIRLPRLNWAFIIENKFQSNQHEGQLSKYAERVKSIFEPDEGALKVRGIFLTLYEEPPQDESFVPIHYSAICEVLPNLLEQHSETIRGDVAMFVRHYVEIIREATGMSSERDEMEGLARQLYRAHRKVLDFIMEHGATTDFMLAVEAAFGENIASGDDFELQDHTFMFNDHNNHRASFLPRSWVNNIGAELYWEGCEYWWAGYPLICWVQLHEDGDSSSGRLSLYAEVGPLSNYEFRKSLIERIDGISKDNASKLVGFQKGSTELGKKYSKFLKNNVVQISDTQNIEELEKAINTLVKRFIPVFDMLAPIMWEFREHGTVENMADKG